MYNFPQHAAGIFETVDEQVQLLRNFIVQARQANRQISLFIHDWEPEDFLARVSGDTLDLYQGLKEGWFLLHSAEQVYLAKGYFDIQATYSLLESSLQMAKDNGFSGLSISGIMTWANAAGVQPEVMAEYEFGLAELFRRNSDLTALCLYSKSRFDLQDISVQCNCHAHVVTPSECSENPILKAKADSYVPHLLKAHDFVHFWNLFSRWGTPLSGLRGSRAKSLVKIFSETRLELLKTLEDEENHKNPEIFKLIGLLEDKLDQLELSSALHRT